MKSAGLRAFDPLGGWFSQCSCGYFWTSNLKPLGRFRSKHYSNESWKWICSRLMGYVHMDSCELTVASCHVTHEVIGPLAGQPQQNKKWYYQSQSTAWYHPAWLVTHNFKIACVYIALDPSTLTGSCLGRLPYGLMGCHGCPKFIMSEHLFGPDVGLHQRCLSLFITDVPHWKLWRRGPFCAGQLQRLR